MSRKKYQPAKYGMKAFNCPHCGIYAKQFWESIVPNNKYYRATRNIYRKTSDDFIVEKWDMSTCKHCNRAAMWYNENIIQPQIITIDEPHKSLPDDIKQDYNEAAEVLYVSNRASAALLRLALQKLLKQIGGKGKSIEDDIQYLCKHKVLSEVLKEVSDIVRIAGNKAVHPGKVNIDEDKELVGYLFTYINMIAYEKFTLKSQADSLKNIENDPNRDKQKPEQKDNTKKK